MYPFWGQITLTLLQIGLHVDIKWQKQCLALKSEHSKYAVKSYGLFNSDILTYTSINVSTKELS